MKRNVWKQKLPKNRTSNKQKRATGGTAFHRLFSDWSDIMKKIKTLSIDLETYSSISLKKAGVYPYAESPDFEILLFGYSINGGHVQVVDIACGEQIPEAVLAAITDDTVEKWAFNASFERVCLSYWLNKHHPEHFKSYSIPEDSVRKYLDPSSWYCSIVWCAYMGLPLSLEGAGAVLKIKSSVREKT